MPMSIRPRPPRPDPLSLLLPLLLARQVTPEQLLPVLLALLESRRRLV